MLCVTQWFMETLLHASCLLVLCKIQYSLIVPLQQWARWCHLATSVAKYQKGNGNLGTYFFQIGLNIERVMGRCYKLNAVSPSQSNRKQTWFPWCLVHTRYSTYQQHCTSSKLSLWGMKMTTTTTLVQFSFIPCTSAMYCIQKYW